MKYKWPRISYQTVNDQREEKIEEIIVHRKKNAKKKKAAVPNPLLTHFFVSPSLATEVMYQKYYLW